jgi:hypothetical protein
MENGLIAELKIQVTEGSSRKGVLEKLTNYKSIQKFPD